MEKTVLPFALSTKDALADLTLAGSRSGEQGIGPNLDHRGDNEFGATLEMFQSNIHLGFNQLFREVEPDPSPQILLLNKFQMATFQFHVKKRYQFH